MISASPRFLNRNHINVCRRGFSKGAQASHKSVTSHILASEDGKTIEQKETEGTEIPTSVSVIYGGSCSDGRPV